MIPIYSNSLGEEELKALAQVFQSKWLGMGSECRNLELELAEYWKSKNVLLINNCTAGLFIACRALKIGQGDEVIVSTVNFLGCANAVLACGAKPIFADVDLNTLNILPEEIARLKNSKTKAIILLHYGGHAADYDLIKESCGSLPIIEDAANAVASTYKGKACGTLGDIGSFSFDAMKILVMGDGGALSIQNEEIALSAKALRYLGFQDKATSGVASYKEGIDRWWEFDIDVDSGRFISNDMLAAIGRVQLRKLPLFIQSRKNVWSVYQNELAGIKGIICPPEPLKNSTSSYYIYWIRVEPTAKEIAQGINPRDGLAKYLADNGVYSSFRYFPLHRVPYYKCNVSLPFADTINETVLNLPLHQNLSSTDVSKVIETVREFMLKRL